MPVKAGSASVPLGDGQPASPLAGVVLAVMIIIVLYMWTQYPKMESSPFPSTPESEDSVQEFNRN